MTRPDPDALLARVQAEEAGRREGRLKIFFGAAPGVGKTYAMLGEAREQRAAGRDVVVGVVETHGRADTAALLEGFEVLPRREQEHRGVALREFDLDAALARRPALLLVDELAHTNVSGSRHAKRWQDVAELLAAGIDVATTVNVQHLESLNDIVAQITGVQVRETLPDSLIERADEIELIDLSPDELLQRMRDGKVYLPEQAERATRSFFRKGNLIALRELALRRTAERVDAQMELYRRDRAIVEPWPAHDRLLVCVGPRASGPQLVRAARRMAARLRVGWIAASVELPEHAGLPEPVREQLLQTMRLAEQLGAEIVTLPGARVSDEILTYARLRNVSKILVGRPGRPRWKRLLLGSPVDELIRRSGAIDVHVVGTAGADSEPSALSAPPESAREREGAAYIRAALIVAACTVVSALAHALIEPANLVMVYLLGVLAVALWLGRGPSILAAVLSVAAFDFFVVPPRLTFAVTDTQYLITFAVMLTVGLVISTQAARVRQQALAATLRERRTAALYRLSREFASLRGMEQLLQATVANLSATVEGQVVLLLPVRGGRLQPWGSVAGWWSERVSERMVFAPAAADQGVAQWVYDRGEPAGQGTATLPSASAWYLPLRAARGTVGVLGVRPAPSGGRFTPEQRALLETFANQIALAIERIYLADEAQAAQVQAETERTRAALLAAVSHDLRTPLATIAGASSTLADGGATLTTEARTELATLVAEEARRLARLVGNLLEMSRLEGGALRLTVEPQPLEEVVGAALTRLEEPLRDRPVAIDLPPDLPLIPYDAVLIEQVLVNLLENALRHTPAGGPIALGAAAGTSEVVLTVADRGPGIPPGDEERVFEKFYRAPGAGDGGVGLGLAICRAIVAAHGGRIWAEARPGGGALFLIRLPLIAASRPPAREGAA